MAKKPVVPGELKGLLTGVHQVENPEEPRQEEQPAASTVPEAPTVVQEPAPSRYRYGGYKRGGETSIDRVIAYAQQYKESEMEMATVVLADDMKSMLDKLKTSLPVKTPFKYLLSGIIREYFETHKAEITDLILRF